MSMSIVVPKMSLQIEEANKQTVFMDAGVRYVVPTAFIEHSRIQFRDDPFILTEKYKPTNFYNGENLDGKSFICFRSGGIGDLLFVSVSLRELKKRYPTSELSIGCDVKFGSILENPSYKVENMPMKEEVLKNYDYVLYFTNVIEGSKEAESVDGYDVFRNRFHLDNIESYIPLLYISHNIKQSVKKTLRDIEDRNIRCRIVCQYAASVPKRTFPPKLYYDLINALPAENYQLYFVGSGSQVDGITELVASIPLNKKPMVTNASLVMPSLMHVAELIRCSDLVIAPDSSMLHIASALDTPMIGIYGGFPSALRINHYRNAIGIDSMSECEYAHGKYKSCFEHGVGPCKMAKKLSKLYPPCLEHITHIHILDAMSKLKLYATTT